MTNPKQRPQLIALSGVHRTGKTTLAKQLAEATGGRLR